MPEKNLAGKIAAIMNKVTPLAKEGTNQGQGYKFVTVQQMIEMLRPLMANEGITMYPHGVTCQYSEGETRQGGRVTMAHMTVVWLLTDGVTEYTIMSEGEANDTGDKAANKAFTAAQKQALSKTFMISADEDNDASHVEVERRPPSNYQSADICPEHGVPYVWTEKQKAGGYPPSHKQGNSWCTKRMPAPGDEDDPRTPVAPVTAREKAVAALTARMGKEPMKWAAFVKEQLPALGIRNTTTYTDADWDAVGQVAGATTDADDLPWDSAPMGEKK